MLKDVYECPLYKLVLNQRSKLISTIVSAQIVIEDCLNGNPLRENLKQEIENINKIRAEIKTEINNFNHCGKCYGYGDKND